MTRADPQMKVRLPAQLKEDIEAAAKTAGRSMNAQIVFMLNRYFEMAPMYQARLYESARDERIADARPEDLTVGDRILKEFNEQQTAMLMGLLVKHGVLSDEQGARDALLKPLAIVQPTSEENANPARTPKIPGQNARKEGLGAAPKEPKQRRLKVQTRNRKVVE
nr:Arc family DNA-binding protein [Achromobacter mucicolens]